MKFFKMQFRYDCQDYRGIRGTECTLGKVIKNENVVKQ